MADTEVNNSFLLAYPQSERKDLGWNSKGKNVDSYGN
jgi:hypothetical protein